MQTWTNNTVTCVKRSQPSKIISFDRIIRVARRDSETSSPIERVISSKHTTSKCILKTQFFFMVRGRARIMHAIMREIKNSSFLAKSTEPMAKEIPLLSNGKMPCQLPLLVP